MRDVWKNKWSLDLSRLNVRRDLPKPPGFFPDRQFSTEVATPTDDPDLIIKRSWEIASAPLKQVPMNLFFMWMVGSSISLFPIIIVSMMFFRPIQALFSIQTTFKSIEGRQATLQRIVYLLGNLISIGMAVYKCQVMGLLPTHPSDWLAFVEPPKRLEFADGGFSL